VGRETGNQLEPASWIIATIALANTVLTLTLTLKALVRSDVIIAVVIVVAPQL